ncbi:MAG TPA: GAF domain-containing sensor histidine kinase [Solirubrobacteraceae bacterium]|nr:GAF domain-containing sensor histidine kinase [Solirubrobacteraceae bacterium]
MTLQRHSRALGVERLRQVIELGSTVLTELEEESVLERVLEAAQTLTGARHAALEVIEGSCNGPKCRSASAREGRVGDRGGACAGRIEIEHALSVPISVRGRLWGRIHLVAKEHGELDDSDADALGLLASWAAIAIEQARMHASARARQEALGRAVSNLQAMQEITLALVGEADPARTLSLVAERARRLVGARSVSIMLFEGAELVAAAGAGDAQDLRAARVAAGQHALEGAHSPLVVPMLCRQERLGLLIARDHAERPFSPEDEDSLRSLAATAAAAVAGARLIAAERLRAVLEATESERRRWARDLHDETLQALGALRMTLASARRQADLAAWQRLGATLLAQLERDLASLRAIIADLQPPILAKHGLPAAIEALASHHQSANGLSVRCDLSPGLDVLSDQLKSVVFRIAQEALTNVVKHAQARSALIEIAACDEELMVAVSDDGVGFDCTAPRGGFGLEGLRERVAMVGGALTICSGSHGTSVRAAIPLSGADMHVRPAPGAQMAPTPARGAGARQPTVENAVAAPAGRR